MNNLFVYCEIEEGNVADVSLELLTKGRSLANQLNCQLEAVVAGSGLKDIEKQILPYGVDKLHVFDGEGLYPYTSLPHTAILVNLFKEEQPQICLMGATVIGRDLGPRVSSALTSGLTADCTSLEIGDHDENISFEQSVDVLEKEFPGKGKEYAEKLRDYTIALYKKCADYALKKGIIIADTKFEFGLDENGQIVLGDEMLTPDSSRFWPLAGYEVGKSQPSYDKQYVRDWLKANPDSNYLLPQDVIDKTIEKYKEAYEKITGETF